MRRILERFTRQGAPDEPKLLRDENPLEPGLEEKLKRLRLQPELLDPDTLSVRRVPLDQRTFNKPHTNLLIKRGAVGGGAPCFVCVDDDLEYSGGDPDVTRIFAAGPKQEGWRVLTFGGLLLADLSVALNYALEMLGADEESVKGPPRPATRGGELLALWSQDLSRAVEAGSAFPTLFREEEIEQAAACVLGWVGRLPLITGEAGTGKTNLLFGIADLLSQSNRRILSVNMGSLMAGTLFESEREALLTELLREAREKGVVLALEQAEWTLIGVPRSLVLLREALDQGTRLIASTTEEHVPRFVTHPLDSRLESIRLSELCASDTLGVLEGLRPALVRHHGVAIDREAENAVVERSHSMEGSQPGKAVKLLDGAAARARLTGSAKVSLLDVYVAASRMGGDGV